MRDSEQICTECLEEMFARVGLTYPDKTLTKHKDWYTRHTWTKAEEADFEAWMLKKLKRHRMRRPESEVGMFLLTWGWKTAYKVFDNAGRHGHRTVTGEGAE